jgi:hypothetical protein
MKMLVRIRFGKGSKVVRTRRKNRRVAMAFASFLTPAAVMAAALGMWRLAQDPHWASDFASAKACSRTGRCGSLSRRRCRPARTS